MSIQNVFTKRVSGERNNSLNLCNLKGLSPEVVRLYEQYRGECNRYFLDLPKFDPEDKKYYVYAWHTITKPKRYFYVGKGTGQRYQHIRREIKKDREGKNNIRFERYSIIEEKHGIDFEILLDGLSEYEALIYEQCKKGEFLDAGEVLLNVEGMPDDKLPEGWYDPKKQEGRAPTLIKDPFYSRYLDDDKTPFFDEISEEGLSRVYLYPYFILQDDPDVIRDNNDILNWLEKHKHKVYKTVSKRTCSIIIQGNLMYDTYIRFRDQGKLIYSSKDILNFIRSFD